MATNDCVTPQAGWARHPRGCRASGRSIPVLTSLVCVIIVIGEAQAQSGNVSVRERPRPEYEALGKRLGAFILNASATFSKGYNDNIFATSTDQEEDFLYRAEQNLVLRSTWSRHAIRAGGSAEYTGHHELTDEDRAEWGVFVSGRLDVSRSTTIDVAAHYDQKAEQRSSPSSPTTAAEPIVFDIVSAEATVTHTFNRLGLIGGFELRHYDYNDGRRGDGTILDQDDRDRIQYDVRGRTEYEHSERTFLFLEAAGNARTYDRQPPLAPTDRDSHGFKLLAGLGLDLAKLVRGEVGVGYRRQLFEDSAAGDLSGLAVRANVEWFISGLTTVHFGLSIDQADSDIAGSLGSEQFQVRVGADHELLRNLILGISADYLRETFDGISRQDDRYKLELNATYYMNRHISLRGEYGFEDQTSRGPNAGRQYTANRVSGGLTVAW